jgi:transposase
MPGPHPVSLRRRAVEASDELGLREAARLFQVGTASLKRWRALRRGTGGLEPRPMGGSRNGRLSDGQAGELTSAVDEEPDRTIRELRDLLLARTGVSLGISTVSRRIRDSGLFLKKKTLFATERDSARVKVLREDFLTRQPSLDVGRLVFVDEAGATIAMTRARARARRGQRVFGRVPRNRGQVTLVVLDNGGAHTPKIIKDAVEAAGASLLFVPPYSPEFNPIELYWSKLKALLRTAGARIRPALRKAIAAAMDAITPHDTAGWVRHCGYRCAGST